MSLISNNIFETIGLLTDQQIKEAGYDKTGVATIIDVINSDIGEYRVLYENAYISAFAIGNNKFTTNETVYLLIPSNNLNTTKYILGPATKNSSEINSEISIEDNYDRVGGTAILLSNDSKKIPSQNSWSQKIYPSKDADNDTLAYIKTLEANLQRYSSCVLSAEFKTNLQNVTGGTFGLRMTLQYQNEKLVICTLSSTSMKAKNIYLMLNWSKQSKAFDNLKFEEFLCIDKIELFGENITTEDNEPVQGSILVRKIDIWTAVKKPVTTSLKYLLSISSREGLEFDSNTDPNAKITLIALLRKTETNAIVLNALYYWYKEDWTEPSSADPYSEQGWAPMRDNRNNSNTQDIALSDILARSRRFKCIARLNGVSYEDTIEIVKIGGVLFSIEQTKNSNNINLKLIKSDTKSQYTYQWYKKDSLGEISKINEQADSYTILSPSSIDEFNIYYCAVFKQDISGEYNYFGCALTTVYAPTAQDWATQKIIYEYKIHDKHDVAPGKDDSDWAPDAPLTTKEKPFLWVKLTISYNDSTIPDDITIYLLSGVGVAEVFEYYYYMSQNDIPINVPNKTDYGTIETFKEALKTNGWLTDAKKLSEDDKYQWQITLNTYTDGSFDIIGPKCTGIYAKNGDSALILLEVITEWAESDTNILAEINVNDLNWVENFDQIKNTDQPYIWTREKSKYQDPNKENKTVIKYSQPRVDFAIYTIRNWAIATDTTYIDGAKIYTGSITADQIDVNSVFARQATIGGWQIGDNLLYSEGVILSSAPVKNGLPETRISVGSHISIMDREELGPWFNNELSLMMFLKEVEPPVPLAVSLNGLALTITLKHDYYSSVVVNSTDSELQWVDYHNNNDVYYEGTLEWPCFKGQYIEIEGLYKNKRGKEDEDKIIDGAKIKTQSNYDSYFKKQKISCIFHAPDIGSLAVVYVKLKYHPILIEEDNATLIMKTDGSGSIGGWGITLSGLKNKLDEKEILLNTDTNEVSGSFIFSNKNSPIALLVTDTTKFLDGEFHCNKGIEFEDSMLLTFEIPIKISLYNVSGTLYLPSGDNYDFTVNGDIAENTSNIPCWESKIGTLIILIPMDDLNDIDITNIYITFKKNSFPQNKFVVLYDGSMFAMAMSSRNISVDVIQPYANNNGILTGTWNYRNSEIATKSDIKELRAELVKLIREEKSTALSLLE